MRKVVSIFLALIFIFLVGCGDGENYSEYPFVNAKWERETECDTEYIFFSDKGEFSYYCACGNPVNDSDLCDGFSYDEPTKTISLDYMEELTESVTEITVQKCSEEELVLDFGSDTRIFYLSGEKTDVDKITYEGEEYSLIEYNLDKFNYGLTEGGNYEEDEYYKIPHDKWDIIYYNDDLFAKDSTVDEINSYYGDDDNYSWWVRVESVELDTLYTVDLVLSESEIEYIYNMEELEREETIQFEDIEKFATLAKTSKDGLITATTELLWHNDSWYWRSEIIDEKTEGWPEYIFKLPQSLSERIVSPSE